MKYEATIHFQYGSVTIKLEAAYFGHGTIDEGVQEMLEAMYPSAVSISVHEEDPVMSSKYHKVIDPDSEPGRRSVEHDPTRLNPNATGVENCTWKDT